jgi:hypothetical protein
LVILRDFARAMAESPMHMRSAVKLAGVLALAAVATTACASQNKDLLRAEQAKFMRESSVDVAQKHADYLKCVLGDAKTYAMDPGSDAVAPGDLADVSLVKCGALLKSVEEDFGMEMFSGGEDVARAAAAATRTTDTVRSSARGQAVALIVDARRKRSSTPTTKEAGS